MNAPHPAPDDGPVPASQAAWARYWRTGALHSCATSFTGNYGGEIARFWQARFQGLAAGGRVLDIGTGNGALPHLLIGLRGGDGIECDAVDAAPIAPAWVAELPKAQQARLRFHGQTVAERLPFPDGVFDLVTSQYGLEYTELTSSVAQLLRVSKRPATVALVAHHAASRPVAMARDELAHVDWLLAPSGLVKTAHLLLEPFERARTEAGRQSLSKDAAAMAERQHFNLLQRQLSDRAAAAPCPDVLFEVRQALASTLDEASRHGVAPAQRSLEALVTSLLDSRHRLHDLVRCALDADGLRNLLQQLGSADNAEVQTVSEAGHLMGWGAVARLHASG